MQKRCLGFQEPANSLSLLFFALQIYFRSRVWIMGGLCPWMALEAKPAGGEVRREEGTEAVTLSGYG